MSDRVLKLSSSMLFLMALAFVISFVEKGFIGVVLGVVVIISLIIVMLKKTSVIKLSKEHVLIILVCVSWLLSCMFGLNPDKAINEWWQHVGMIIGGVIIYMGLNATVFDFQRFFHTISVLSVLPCIYIIGQTIMPFVPNDFISSSYASVLAMIVPMTLGLAISAKRNYLWWGIFLLQITAIFALGGRTGWVALSVIVVLSLIFFPMDGLRQRLITGICTIILFVLGMSGGISAYKNTVSEHFFEARVTAIDLHRPASGRLDIWAEALTEIENRPWLGAGIKGFRELQLTKDALHAHNAVLELLIDTGFLGLLAVSALVGYMVLKFIYAYWRTNNYLIKRTAFPIIMACVAYGTASMALTSFFHAWWFLYCVVLLILLRLATDHLKNTPKT
jgi:O-antigen ligase